MADDESIWIQSTRDPDREHSCQLDWGPIQWYAPVADVRSTALDLVTCAAYSEMMMKLVGIGLPAAQVSAFTTDLLSDAGRTQFGAGTTLDLMPAGSTKRREALVLVSRGSMRGALSPHEARQMALRWMETAEATESDCLVATALTSALGATDEDAEALFAALRKLRGVPDA